MTTFRRDSNVIAKVLERANEYCEGCENPAPFIRALDGTPYLEVHHIVLLAEDGEDTVENTVVLYLIVTVKFTLVRRRNN
ncbi:HNH endonuclease [Aneurinibacillus aneurinilyticus]|uniref:HNH endonuclease n=1 Tax=Aneurinibacillus aneurinilyticus TaxID=1391 RepID=UPI003524F352